MSFRILVGGEEVKVIDEQVTRVSVMTPSGVRSEFGIADEGAIDLIVTTAQPGGPMRLDHLEALHRKQEAERVQGLPAGQEPYTVPKDLNSTQGDHSYIAEGREPEGTEAQSVSPPAVDLTEGLEPGDDSTRTARLEAFSSSGDAEAAVKDNPPGSTSSSAEVQAPVEETTSDTTDDLSFSTATDDTTTDTATDDTTDEPPNSQPEKEFSL